MQSAQIKFSGIFENWKITLFYGPLMCCFIQVVRTASINYIALNRIHK